MSVVMPCHAFSEVDLYSFDTAHEMLSSVIVVLFMWCPAVQVVQHHKCDIALLSLLMCSP